MGRDVLVLVPELPAPDEEPHDGQCHAGAYAGSRLPYLTPEERKAEEPDRDQEQRNARHDRPLRAGPGLSAEEDIDAQEDRNEQGQWHWFLARGSCALGRSSPADRVQPPRRAD